MVLTGSTDRAKNKQHHLQWPDLRLLLSVLGSKCIEQLKQLITAVCKHQIQSLNSYVLLSRQTHPLNGPLSGTTQVSRYWKGKTNLDFTEARDSEWQRHQLGHMQVCTLLQTDNHASTPTFSFFTGRMPFMPPNQQHQSTSVSTAEFIPAIHEETFNRIVRLLGCRIYSLLFRGAMLHNIRRVPTWASQHTSHHPNNSAKTMKKSKAKLKQCYYYCY